MPTQRVRETTDALFCGRLLTRATQWVEYRAWQSRHVTVKGNPMSKHRLTYIEMYPEPVHQEPPAWLVFLGALCAAVLGTFALIVLMNLPQILRG